jgi:hypothetical protein
MTESGKTTLAKRLAAQYKARGISVIVLDPLGDPEWSCDFKTHDPDVFLDVFWQSRRCAVFIDEASESAGRFDKPMHKTATKGRHWGHACHYISQRSTQISPNVRDQCSNLFLFSTSFEDCKTHAKEWNNKGIEQAATLRQGEYLHCTRFGELKTGTLFA